MQLWRRWGLWVFLVVAMACGGEENPAECEGKEEGTSCNTGICHNNKCQAPEEVPCGVGAGTHCEEAGETCREGSCQTTTQPECIGAAPGTTCDNNTGICHNNKCQAPEEVPCGVGAGTHCEVAGETCQEGSCQTTTQPECIGAAPGTACDNNTGICHNNTCKSPEEVPCGVGAGTHCEVAGETCREGSCQSTTVPCQPGILELSIEAPSVPLSPINAAAVFSVTVACFENAQEARGVRLSVDTVPEGLTLLPEDGGLEGNSLFFGVPVTYDGRAAFPTGLATVPFALTGIPEGYTLNAPQHLTLNIRDGQASTPSRLIPVSQDKVSAFNRYVATTTEGPTRHYQLVTHVTLPEPAAGESNWTPIELRGGSFDGNNLTLSGLRIHAPEGHSQGLFKYIDKNAVVTNLGLHNARVEGMRYVGSLVGVNDGTVRNCYASGNVVIGNPHPIWSEHSVGGLAGANSGFIENSYVSGSVTGDATVGGMVGDNTHGTLRNCYVIGSDEDKIRGKRQVGGVVGYSEQGTVRNCYSTLRVEGDRIGGIVGWLWGKLVENCMALNPAMVGNVTGRVVGRLEAGPVRDNYAFGGMTGTSGSTGWNTQNGASISAIQLQTASGFLPVFLASPWSYEEGRLPGLFGQTVAMPAHLSP